MGQKLLIVKTNTSPKFPDYSSGAQNPKQLLKELKDIIHAPPLSNANIGFPAIFITIDKKIIFANDHVRDVSIEFLPHIGRDIADMVHRYMAGLHTYNARGPDCTIIDFTDSIEKEFPHMKENFGAFTRIAKAYNILQQEYYVRRRIVR